MDNRVLLLPEDKETLNENKNNLKSLVSKSAFNWFLFGISLIVSIILFIMFFSAADLMKTGGLEIMSIQSVGGQTLEEAYYQNLGYIYEGYCVAMKAMGVFCSSLLFLFGVSRLKNVR